MLKDVSFTVDQGEIAVIMGTSGGGKTTLLKCIAGLLTPNEGEIIIEGINVLDEPEKAHESIGMVFQYAALFDSLTVRDNILFGLRRMRKTTAQEQEAILDRQLKAVGLGDIKEKLPSELSGGMRKRVGLARALCIEPKILLYDEPTSGLDPVTAYSIDKLIVDSNDRTGATSIVVSHDVTSIFRVADRILFLSNGHVLFNGTPDEFRESQDTEIRELVEKARAENLAIALGDS